jgi:hypothetical protein
MLRGEGRAGEGITFAPEAETVILPRASRLLELCGIPRALLFLSLSCSQTGSFSLLVLVRACSSRARWRL